MMKFMLIFMIFNFMFNHINKFLIQVIYQNFLFIIMFMFLINFPFNNLNFWLKIYYMMGMDCYSFGLILLSIWIMSLMIMVSGNNLIMLNYQYFLFSLNFLMLFIIMCFMMMNLLMFYIFFESSLLPIFLLVMGWGLHIDRLQAGIYLMLYTLFGSFPLLILIMLIYNLKKTLMLNLIEFNILNFLIYLIMIMAFLIKMPMHFFHLWLPKAHVEAPLVGSMILAGVMLKLGSYGMLRFMMIVMNMSMKFNKFFIIISLMGGIYSSLMCSYQIDMKMLVAYSSIVHMSILMAGLMTLMNWGIYGSILMMVAHGLCSSSLFYLININYERFNSRSLLINKGMINLFPSLSFMWFLMCSSNLSFPPSMNLFGEIILINSLILWSLKLIIIILLLMFMSVLYTLYLYSYSQHGGIYKLSMKIKSILILEFMILILHWVPLNLMFINFYVFL